MQTLRLILIGLHGLLGIAAIGAGQAFVRDPSGAALGMAVEPLRGSPFTDYRVPGAFLALVIGGANLVSAVLLARGARLSAWASFGTGLLLVVWVAIQTTILGVQHWSQAIWWTLFPAVAALGAALVRRERGTAALHGTGDPRQD